MPRNKCLLSSVKHSQYVFEGTAHKKPIELIKRIIEFSSLEYIFGKPNPEKLLTHDFHN